MKTTIDRAGRVVIPKAIRDQAGLEPGTELNIRLDNGIVEILPAEPAGRVIEREGVLLWEASGPAQFTENTVRDAIRRNRERRDQEVTP